MGGSKSFWAICGMVAAATVSLAAGTPSEAPAPPPDAGGVRTGQIVISLPALSDPAVSCTFGEGRVSLSLPAGSTFPIDFEQESNGLLRSGEVVPVDAEHVRLDLKLASGLIDQLEVTSKRVVVKLRRRFAESRDSAAGHEDEYRLGPDDKIQIAVNGDPKLTQQLVVGPDGRVTIPLVGDLTLGGLTVREATENVTELLARDYLVDPKVDLQITEYKSRWVMVTGEVGKPGRVALRGGATLKDALADADGLGINAGEDIIISRDAPQGGGKILIPVDRQAFEHAVSNPPLMTGDIVSVPTRPYVYVQGEVHLSGKVPLERGMTLMKAISICGGLTEWASESKVQIMSEGSTGQKKLFNLKDIRSMKIPDPPLKGGDVIYVRRKFL